MRRGIGRSHRPRVLNWLEMSANKSVTISAKDFKARCPELIDHVERSGVAITITKRGKPIALVVPPNYKRRRPLFGSLPVKIVGDIVRSVHPEWEAER